jgi:hypothetical protein
MSKEALILYWDIMIKLGIIVGPGQNVLVWDFDMFLGEQRHLEVWSLLCGTAHPISSCAKLIFFLHVNPSQLTVFGSRWSLGRQPYASAGTISEMNLSIVGLEASKSFITESLWVTVRGRHGAWWRR